MVFAIAIYSYLEHDDGAGQETTTKTALIAKVNRARTSRGSERKTGHRVMFLPTTHRKEHGMKRGHVRGTKTERTGASDWYKAIEAENLKRIEAAWQAKQEAGK